jgi:hypothetical protein
MFMDWTFRLTGLDLSYMWDPCFPCNLTHCISTYPQLQQ